MAWGMGGIWWDRALVNGCVAVGHGEAYSFTCPATFRWGIAAFHESFIRWFYVVGDFYIGMFTATAGFCFYSCQFMTIGTTFRFHPGVSTTFQRRFCFRLAHLLVHLDIVMYIVPY